MRDDGSASQRLRSRVTRSGNTPSLTRRHLGHGSSRLTERGASVGTAKWLHYSNMRPLEMVKASPLGRARRIGIPICLYVPVPGVVTGTLTRAVAVSDWPVLSVTVRMTVYVSSAA